MVDKACKIYICDKLGHQMINILFGFGNIISEYTGDGLILHKSRIPFVIGERIMNAEYHKYCQMICKIDKSDMINMIFRVRMFKSFEFDFNHKKYQLNFYMDVLNLSKDEIVNQINKQDVCRIAV